MADTPRKSRLVPVTLALVAVGVLIAIAGVLAVKAAENAAREQDQRRSLNQMKQIMLGLMNYSIVYKELPPAAKRDAEGRPLLSWRVLVLPYLEETDQPGLHKEFRLDEPWDSPHNRELIKQMPRVFRSSEFAGEPGTTNYLAVVGEGCAFDGTAKGKNVPMVASDSPRAIVMVEADEAVPWTKPDDWEFDAANLTTGLGKLRSAGWLAAWADGSTTVVPNRDAQFTSNELQRKSRIATHRAGAITISLAKLISSRFTTIIAISGESLRRRKESTEFLACEIPRYPTQLCSANKLESESQVTLVAIAESAINVALRATARSAAIARYDTAHSPRY